MQFRYTQRLLNGNFDGNLRQQVQAVQATKEVKIRHQVQTVQATKEVKNQTSSSTSSSKLNNPKHQTSSSSSSSKLKKPNIRHQVQAVQAN
jgi:hypothetical protein